MEHGLGIDFGGVIAERTGTGTDHPAELAPESIRPVPGAFDAIAEMNGLLGGRVWIVSKASPGTERAVREWLRYHRFEEQTGLPPSRARFVRNRSGKLDVCRGLGITHFVDDRAETLEMLEACVEHLFLFGSGPAGDGIIAVGDWADLSRALRRSITGIPGR